MAADINNTVLQGEVVSLGGWRGACVWRAQADELMVVMCVCVMVERRIGLAPGKNKPFYSFDSLSFSSFWMRLFRIKEKSCLLHGL